DQAGTLPGTQALGLGLDHARKLGGFGNHARRESAVLADTRGEQPYAAILSEGTDGINESVDQVAVLLAPPEQHDIAQLIGILIQEFPADDILDRLTDLRIAILVPSNILDALLRFDPE